MDFAEIALFKCCGIIYLVIDAAIYMYVVQQASHTLSIPPACNPWDS